MQAIIEGHLKSGSNGSAGSPITSIPFADRSADSQVNSGKGGDANSLREKIKVQEAQVLGCYSNGL